jgi:hypothetical protein
MDTSERHPATVDLLRWFDYAHLPPHLALISEKFERIVRELIEALDDGPELTTALRKLLEAKDCAVRAAIVKREMDSRIPDHRCPEDCAHLTGQAWHDLHSFTEPAG